MTEQDRTKQNKTEDLRTGYIYSLRTYKNDLYFIGYTFDNLNKHFYQLKRKCKENKKYYVFYDLLKFDDCFINLEKTIKTNDRIFLKSEAEKLKRENKQNIIIKNEESKKPEIIKNSYYCDFCKLKMNKKSKNRHLKTRKHLLNLKNTNTEITEI